MRITLCLVGLGAMLVAACQSALPTESGTAYLVRHAEKETSETGSQNFNPRDPLLTQVGALRAEALADRLENAGIVEIWSSDTTRTRETAKPLAERLGLAIQIYDPFELEAFAAQLKTRSEATVLVVGHSNTTPPLAQLLGADPGPEIVEASEYDRLYVIELETGLGRIERYGEASDRAPVDG